ncbi:ribonuclease domain-containing protein [Aristaeella lactis]|uniref:Ribonuclease n=1 Tax=Aristaeella lactis TaxID=3046383 RepID=A0AC61PNE5_9FIRM|nr:ribonuclease domain-containing protein [Aristaeella lactis]QUA52510.1 ribonuclease [Aristaeella lactis]SMC76576.1 ribonuclease [Aristaeella lactis]
MFGRRRLIRFSKLFAVLLAAVLLLCACSANAVETAKRKKNTAAPAVTETPAVAEPTAEPGPLDEAQRIADYIFEHGELPDNFITKKEAQALGWDKYVNKVSDVAPGKSIGGDYFGNYEKQLPVVQGRKYYEADCYYFGGDRNEYRIIYSNDGHVWFTGDHYQTFIELFPTDN